MCAVQLVTVLGMSSSLLTLFVVPLYKMHKRQKQNVRKQWDSTCESTLTGERTTESAVIGKIPSGSGNISGNESRNMMRVKKIIVKTLTSYAICLISSTIVTAANAICTSDGAPIDVPFLFSLPDGVLNLVLVLNSVGFVTKRSERKPKASVRRDTSDHQRSSGSSAVLNIRAALSRIMRRSSMHRIHPIPKVTKQWLPSESVVTRVQIIQEDSEV